MERFPAIEPYDVGMLDFGDGNSVYWDVSGNPDGKPALCVHGGPGSGCPPGMRRNFDPRRYRIVQFDQRGCGRSTPHASDPATDMSVNTTEHLIADMERLRKHLGIDRWLLYGGSWGTTLILAYAEQYPHRVSEIVVSNVTTTRRTEIDWLYRGVARFFPEEFELFRQGASAADDDLVTAYARLMEHPDPLVRERAAHDWSAWEDTVVSLEPNAKPNAYSDKSPAALLAFVRITTHFLSNAAWLEEGALIRDAAQLAGIPGVLVHGRHDLSCPLDTAWELARAWPGAELIVAEDGGHQGSPTKRAAKLHALARFSRER